MKFMVVWRAVPGKYKLAVEQFLNTGGKMPAGSKTVARYHVPGSVLGWHIVESDDPGLVAQHVAEWGDLLACEVYPLIEDSVAAAAAKMVYGK